MSGTFITPQIPVLTAKAPYDEAQWLLDFSNVIPSGDTIASIASVLCNPIGLTIGATTIATGKSGASLAIGVVLSGGTVGAQYTVTAEITTVAGDQFARSIIVPVQAR
ncbi:MAG: hypothetical protein B7Z71_03900 [Acidocella sp. 21-58-7]|nr:MAG: hypothetical protein B7Z71_03900 [Acidocella sp. 21-58-7]